MYIYIDIYANAHTAHTSGKLDRFARNIWWYVQDSITLQLPSYTIRDPRTVLQRSCVFLLDHARSI
jgi:hypothetical protein